LSGLQDGGDKMSILLSIITVVVSLAFLIIVVVNVAHGRLLLRYSLLWIVLTCISLVMAIFPVIPEKLTYLLGFEKTSNFVFFAVIIFLLLVCFSLSIAISKTTDKYVRLAQYVALIEKRLEKLSDTDPIDFEKK
jgi:hypothetical protein